MTILALMQNQSSLGKAEILPVTDASQISGRRSVQASVKGTGSVAAVIKIYGGNDEAYMKEILSFALSGTGVDSDLAVDNFPFEFYLAELVSISGIGAQVSVTASV